MMFFEYEDMDPEESLRMREECLRDEAVRAEAIAAAIKNNSCHHYSGLGDFLVGRHITVVEIIDEIGDTHLLPIASANLLRWEAIGMLTAALK